ncbi:MAG: hypothetical protein JXR41_00025 [Bacteroidales bacterium]|nr:hypothetical protein [Bacteroidales bacterium]MBN2761444.1 hypothetical protein [Bacteroidales bacterium]
MVSQLFILTIISVDDGHVGFEVSGESERTAVKYDKKNSRFSFEDHDNLSEILANNQVQLQKVIKSALKGKPAPGRQIQCVFIKDFTFLNNHDYNHYIRIDRRGINPAISVSTEETNGIYKLYADGSYAKESNRSGYAGIIVNKEGNDEVYYGSFPGGSSCLMELMAVTEGLKQLGPVKKIRINTDSRFVIRGLAQWIHFWRLNNWQMAYGRKVRYAKHWQQLDKLSQGKLLELKWIKAHSGDNKHKLCHHLAKQLATRGIHEPITTASGGV